MFRRAFWFTTGAAAGVWAATRVQRAMRELTPDALAHRAADKAVDTGHRLKDFALDVRAGMTQREGELNDALGLREPVEDAPPQLPAQQRRPQLGAGNAYYWKHESEDDRTPDRKEDH